MAESWISLEIRNRINSSDCAHGYIHCFDPDCWIFFKNCHPQCVVMISLRELLRKLTLWKLLELSWEKQVDFHIICLFSLGFSFSSILETQHSRITRVVFVRCSLFITPFRLFSPQLNYIRFINLASSVSRRGGEVKKKRSHCVPEPRTHFKQSEGRKKSCGLQISMKANKNQTTWLFPVPCWNCVIMCCCILFYASTLRNKEKLFAVDRFFGCAT